MPLPTVRRGLMGSTILAVWPLLCGSALAQPLAHPPAATTVQLPSFHFFTVQTSVSVPDRGGVWLGGISRSGTGTTANGFGPLATRGGGSQLAGGQMTIHVQIHDLQAMDEALLAQTAGDPRFATFESKPAELPPPELDASAMFAKATAAEAAGQLGAARIWYSMAERRAEEPLRAEIAARRRSLAARRGPSSSGPTSSGPASARLSQAE